MEDNTLYYGNNLYILRQYIKNDSVDLVYLDPPFNSSRNYNVLFKDESGKDSEAQITAFEDTWHWNDIAEENFHYLLTDGSDNVSKMIASMRDFLGTNQMMAYLVMMTIRLVEMYRVLKPTGSLYLHCDPTASHYLKIILDAIFNPLNFQNEIIWSYRRWPSPTKHFQSMHDVIFFYSKTSDKNRVFNVEYEENSASYEKRFKGKTQMLDPETGTRKITLETTSRGLPRRDVWDISILAGYSKERLGYPTQKPLALLERIISASSNPGDVVLDPFCGCGTAIAAAQKLGRKWIGIDITHLSIALQKYRLEAMYPGIKFKVVGEPTDLSAARQLAKDDRYQFQWWALSLIRARPLGGHEGSKTGKKGSDKGIDGVIAFIDDNTNKAKRALVQVKSGHVKSGDIRDLVGTINREQAAIGIFLTLEAPSRDMTTEALSAGYYYSPGWNEKYPRIQILTISELLQGAKVKMPPQFGTFKQAQKVQQEGAEQRLFDFG